jgi:chromosome segregation and condensation protein ScpB
LLEEGKCGNLIAQEGNKRTLNRPKTEETTEAFGALFSLQCVRFITRGSLFIGDPWV